MVEALAKLFAERRKGKEAAVSPVIEKTSDESPPRTLSRHFEADVEPATLTIAPRGKSIISAARAASRLLRAKHLRV
jgi:hypothetical protein